MRNLRSYINYEYIGFFTKTCFIVLLLSNTYSLSAAEEYYTWVDENGVTNYAQKNPLGYQAQFISKSRAFGRRIIKPKPVLPPPTSPRLSDTTNEIDPDSAIAEERAVIQAEINKQKKSNCAIGKKNLARLEMFSRVRVTDKDGESRTLTSDEKIAKEEEARRIIKENCRA